MTIISPRTLLRRSVVPCMSTRVHWHHCWRGSPTCENGGDVCCGVPPLSILWACLHLALSHLLRYHCQNRATTGLLAKVIFLKSTMTSTFSFFFIVTDSPKSHMHWSNYWHSVTGPERSKLHQNVPPTLSPSQPFLARHATPFPFHWKKYYVMRQKKTALETTIGTDEGNECPCHFSMRIPNMKFMVIFRGFLGLKNEGES